MAVRRSIDIIGPVLATRLSRPPEADVARRSGAALSRFERNPRPNLKYNRPRVGGSSCCRKILICEQRTNPKIKPWPSSGSVNQNEKVRRGVLSLPASGVRVYFLFPLGRPSLA